MSEGERLVVLSPEEMQQAAELWLNTCLLKQPVRVVSLRQKSPKAKDAGYFHIVWEPQAEGAGALAYRQLEE